MKQAAFLKWHWPRHVSLFSSEKILLPSRLLLPPPSYSFCEFWALWRTAQKESSSFSSSLGIKLWRRSNASQISFSPRRPFMRRRHPEIRDGGAVKNLFFIRCRVLSGERHQETNMGDDESTTENGVELRCQKNYDDRRHFMLLKSGVRISARKFLTFETKRKTLY